MPENLDLERSRWALLAVFDLHSATYLRVRPAPAASGLHSQQASGATSVSPSSTMQNAPLAEMQPRGTTSSVKGHGDDGPEQQRDRHALEDRVER